MARSYFSFPISEHLEQTPEGFLIARDAVIARTGWQQYLVQELPKDSLEKLGVDVSDGEKVVDVYRSPEELFSKDTIASIEGKPVTDNHPSEEEFVNPNNAQELSFGHVTNVRPGKEPLSSGDMPLLADVYITAEPLLSEVKNGEKRELSLGYKYDLWMENGRLAQKDIIVNHCAVVPRGRGGREVRVLDHEPEELKKILATKSGHGTMAKKGKSGMKLTWKSIFGAGLKAHAADAEPEELADAAIEAAKRHEEAEAEDKGLGAMKNGKFHPIRASEEYKPSKVGERYRYKPGKAAASRRAKLRRAMKRSGKSRAWDGAHRFYHAALDRCLHGEAEDVDIEELLRLLEEYFEEEAEEPEHQEAADEGPEEEWPEDAEAEDGEDEGEEYGEEQYESEAKQEPKIQLDRLRKKLVRAKDEHEAHEDEAEDGEEQYESEAKQEPKIQTDRLRKILDGEVEEHHKEEDAEEEHEAKRAIARDAAISILKDLRPVAARSSDSQFRKWYNAAVKEVSRSAKPYTNGYEKFYRGAVNHDGSPRNKTEAELSRELDKMFAQVRKEGKL